MLATLGPDSSSGGQKGFAVAKHGITVQPASETELADLAAWFRVVNPGSTKEPDAMFKGGFVQAAASGVLGSSLNRGWDTLTEMLAHSELGDQRLSRTLVLSARRDGQTAGMLLAGPPVALYNRVMRTTVSYPAQTVQKMHIAFMAGLWKLDILAVAPEHRGHGLGARLVRRSLDIARKSKVEMMYGQFHAGERLGDFYAGLGFTIPAAGEPVSVLTDFPIKVQTAADEVSFHQTVGLPVRMVG